MDRKKASFFYGNRTNNSIWHKWRYTRFLKNLSSYDLAEMKTKLLIAAKPKYREFIENIDLMIQRKLMNAYDKRINTLLRKDLFELYYTYMKFEEKQDNSSMSAFGLCMSQSYQIDNRWYPSKRK